MVSTVELKESSDTSKGKGKPVGDSKASNPRAQSNRGSSGLIVAPADASCELEGGEQSSEGTLSGSLIACGDSSSIGSSNLGEGSGA